MHTEGHRELFSHSRAMELTGGNEEIVSRLLGLLLRDIPAQRAQIRDLLNQKQWEQLRQLAHKLHGSAIYCATPALAYASNALEALLVEDKLALIAKACADLTIEMDRLEQASAAGELPV